MFKSLQPKRLPTQGTLLRTVNIVIIAFLLVVPWMFEPFRVTQFTQILVLAIAVMGLNLLTGFTGQISVGHGAFFGIGAYTTGLLISRAEVAVGVAVLIGPLVGAVVGAVIGLPSLRIRGTALAIVTLVFGAAFPSVANVFHEMTGGTQGLRVEKLSLAPGSFLAVDQMRYLAVLVTMLLAAGLILALDRSRTGRYLRALGDNEIAAATFGIRAPRLRIGVFTASAALTALAGSLFAVTAGFISSGTSFVTVLGSITFLTALVIGGRAIFLGPLAGAAIAELLPSQIGQISPEWAYLAYGLILVVLLVFAPKGITGLAYPRWLRFPASRKPLASTKEKETS